MRHLRTKLFLSVGIIFLMIAALNYLLPEIIIRRQLDKASILLNQHIDSIQERVRQFSSFLVTYNLTQSAAQLDGASTMLRNASGLQTASTKEDSLWVSAARIAAFDPKIAFVQISSQGKSAVISPGDSALYVPLWAPVDKRMEKGMLWIKIPEKTSLFVAVPTSQTSYLLFDEANLKNIDADTTLESSLRDNLKIAAQKIAQAKTATFTPYEGRTNSSFNIENSVDALYKNLLVQENEWVEKIDLITQLARFQPAKAPAGILKTNAHRGVCLLAEEVFLSSAITDTFAPKQGSLAPYFLLRKTAYGTDLDMAKKQTLAQGLEVEIGFSVSSTIKKLARILKKQVIVYQKGQFALGYDADGKEFNPASFPFSTLSDSSSLISWEGEKYAPFQIDLQVLNLVILTPEAEATALTRFLETTRKQMSEQISFNLVAAIIVSLGIALLLLNSISKKITQPIALLSQAAEELGKGKYDDIVLPSLGSRQDEVATLTHSFENMVKALRDRDKIRGVLNKVVSKEISAEILKGSVELGGEERTITMLFSDIRGFTHLSSNLKPKTVIALLNAYMTQMCRIIDATHGVVDKFVGDEIVALYGAPVAIQNPAIQAIEAALLMIEALRISNETYRKENKPLFEIGIGIHTGNVCVGNMGAENRLNYTVIGSNVNIASRLCSKAAPMQIIVSADTFNVPGVQQRFNFKPLEPLSLKGIDTPVLAYEVLSRK
jgi:class 3 adenylate cyclase